MATSTNCFWPKLNLLIITYALLLLSPSILVEKIQNKILQLLASHAGHNLYHTQLVNERKKKGFTWPEAHFLVTCINSLHSNIQWLNTCWPAALVKVMFKIKNNNICIPLTKMTVLTQVKRSTIDPYLQSFTL